MSAELPKQYNPADIESGISDFWLDSALFHADVTGGGEPFTIVIPPPNVTGALHMGQALDNMFQDVLIRWRRMQGRNVLWMPGTDHAGIATQNVVERKLAEQGLTRKDVGRERFVQEVWKWKEEYGNRIVDQLKRLGCSCDWDRERFTMDEGLSRAVRLAFCTLHERGLIYKGNYIINWCPRCQTALSDDEVEHEDHDGHLWYVRYPFQDDPSGGVVVATTRPETMLGDTAVAVNPKDERFANLIGRTVILPVIEREIPIIADDFVDMEFGTGAVKVTPAHDPNDFEIGKRHGLEEVCVINEDGTMSEHAGPTYAGTDRFECREALVEELRGKGLLVKVEPHQHAIGHCYRCHSVVEPYISEQWFVKMKPLAEAAIRATKDGRVRFFPERWTKFYLSWLENVRDWCISRQIWWGHRIPAWHCGDCGEVNVAMETPEKCRKCGSTNLQQDSDVLDTWFSSALWPFSTMGWPDKTPELDFYYPTNVLVTDRGIIYFWVARMVMMGLELMGKEPFEHVYIHATVLDELGRKMSKSLGNGIDPQVMIEGGEQEYLGRKFQCDGYGADALRFSLAVLTKEGQDVKLSSTKFELGRNFANKLWNATRFVLMNLDDVSEEQPGEPTFEDRWIASRTQSTLEKVTQALEGYLFNDAAWAVYELAWHDFCDWYLELVKPRLYEPKSQADRRRAQETLAASLDVLLRLLHPFTPFMTEYLWGRLKEAAQGLSAAERFDSEALVSASWPEVLQDAIDPRIEEDMFLLQEIVRSVRSVRRDRNLQDSEPVRLTVSAPGRDEAERIRDHVGFLKTMAILENIEIGTGLERPKHAATCVIGQTRLFVELEGLLDLEAERTRLNKQREKISKRVKALEAKLANPNFLEKAPAEVVERQRELLAEFQASLAKISQSLEDLE